VRLITRSDTSLSIALIASALVLFRQPLRFSLDFVESIEQRFQLDLLPALLLLVAAFTFHQYRKWAQMRAEALAAAADAAQARKQSETLQQLMELSRAMSNALDGATLQQVLWKHLPAFAGDKAFWVLVRHHDRWEAVVQDGGPQKRSTDDLEHLAAAALQADRAAEHGRVDAPDGARDTCFPLLAGDGVVGVLGVSGNAPLTRECHDVLKAVAAVVAIGVKNMQLFRDTRELSLRDGLTGCFNRRHALETLDGELRRARRTGAPLSVVMFDVDHFKTVNDRFGHLRGDEVLAAIGGHLARALRSTDVRCRYGGDEFVLILPETPARGAQQVAEALRQDLGRITVTTDEDDSARPVTISVGVAAAMGGELDAKALIARADSALYQAKAAGRNRVCVAALSSTVAPAA
jgi:diguanylate cyclase (GGDEF)-like protein